MVYSPKLWKLPVKPVYTPAGEYLINWMPKLNNYYEPTKNPTKNGAIGVSISSTTEPRPSEAYNKLRTSKNTDSMPRIALSTSDSRHLLALLNDFRTFDWAEEYKYPTVVLDQMKGLLAKYQDA